LSLKVWWNVMHVTSVRLWGRLLICETAELCLQSNILVRKATEIAGCFPYLIIGITI
jgi:hypothetical protein